MTMKSREFLLADILLLVLAVSACFLILTTTIGIGLKFLQTF